MGYLMIWPQFSPQHLPAALPVVEPNYWCFANKLFSLHARAHYLCSFLYLSPFPLIPLQPSTSSTTYLAWPKSIFCPLLCYPNCTTLPTLLVHEVGWGWHWSLSLTNNPGLDNQTIGISPGTFLGKRCYFPPGVAHVKLPVAISASTWAKFGQKWSWTRGYENWGEWMEWWTRFLCPWIHSCPWPLVYSTINFTFKFA